MSDFVEFADLQLCNAAKCYLSNACSGQNHHLKQNRACSEICTAFFYAAEPICIQLHKPVKKALQQQHVRKLQST